MHEDNSEKCSVLVLSSTVLKLQAVPQTLHEFVFVFQNLI
jgi:hypothetical protein